jgi:hypothetical protein
MAEKTQRHPFVVGEQYRNELGAYEVVQIEEPEMVIQYEGGETQRTGIRLQRRIWERIQHEEEIAARRAAKKKRSRRRSGGRSRASFGKDFHGLESDDFRRDIKGTSWRRRTELAGLLALRLSEFSGLVFESHAVYRRPEVYIVQPEHWNSKQSHHAAKFFFQLSESSADYGFYIEKPDEAMDLTWDWPRFVAALSEDKGLQARTLIAMEANDLRTQIEIVTSDGPVIHYVGAENEALYHQEGESGDRHSLEWDDLIEMLDGIPADEACNLHLSTDMEKSEAISAGEGLATQVANIYNALLPLYASAVRR